MQARHCCRLKWAAVATAAGSSHHNPTRRKKLLEKQKFNGVSRAEAGTRRRRRRRRTQFSSAQPVRRQQRTWSRERERERERERFVRYWWRWLACFALLYLQRSLSFPPPLLFLQLPFMTTIMGVLLLLILLKISTATFVFNLVYLQPHLTPPQQQFN